MTRWVWLIPFCVSCGSEDESAAPPVTCPVCEENSMTCYAAVPFDAATLSITSRQTGACAGMFATSEVVLQCESQVICPDGECIPYTFDGTVLEFEHPSGTVRCSAP